MTILLSTVTDDVAMKYAIHGIFDDYQKPENLDINSFRVDTILDFKNCSYIDLTFLNSFLNYGVYSIMRQNVCEGDMSRASICIKILK